MSYVGRFAPSPTGPLHAGSLVAALGSWLDARAHGGRWLVRIEDIDTTRCVSGADAAILEQLAACGLVSDAPVVWQSQRGALYDAALGRLRGAGWVYPCACSRKDIDEALRAQGLEHQRHGERIYPGTCRAGLGRRPVRAWRVWSMAAPHDDQPLVLRWHDRRLGPLVQHLTNEVGDFVLERADGLAAYQLAVVVDDAAQGITDVVRGEDLADNTPRQMHLQRLLGLPTPRYLHLPLVVGADGEKLSKQHGAPPIDVRDPLAALRQAGRVLGIDSAAAAVERWLPDAVDQWRERWGIIDQRRNEGATMNETASGLRYEDTVPGNGSEARSGQQVSVHYTGWLDAGGSRERPFDSSRTRGDPFEFDLGAGEVIRGWDEGVVGMKVGGTRLLQIPPQLGYGARGAGGVIPPNATLWFEVELLAVG